MTGPRHHCVQVPATTANLGPGFDAFGLAVDRYLTVRSLPRDAQPERIRTAGAGAGELPTGDDNLLWRAVEAFCARAEVAVPDIAVRASTEIPLERGLGSSSAAIVAGLVLARAVTGAPVGDPALVELATELEGHPDNVAPALLGGLVACTTADGGGLVIRRINPSARLRPVVLVPDARQATTAARSVVPETLPRADVAAQAARAGHVLGALAGVWSVVATASGDRLHEPERLRVMAATGRVVGALRAAGVHAWLSGAGPSVAAVVDACDVDAVERVTGIGAAEGFEALALRFELSGAFACPDGACALAGPGRCVHCPGRRV